MKLTVIIRDDGPMIHCGDCPSYRTVVINLTEDQAAQIELRETHTIGSTTFRENISQVILEDSDTHRKGVQRMSNCYCAECNAQRENEERYEEKSEHARLRDDAIRTIESLYPADSCYPATADVGAKLLDQAKAEVKGWRTESTEVLVRYAQLCESQEILD